ncbi:MAG: hypothetical protein JSV36_08530 [Anaerolineae bacterium]|nr:MAG: hypothetical protein JSV36_08530 [Anaerolineae bacterium]
MRSYPHLDGNRFSGNHIHSFPHLHGRADSLGHCVAHYDSDAYSYYNADGDDNTDGNGDAYSYCHTDDDGHADGNADAYNHCNTDDDGHTDGNGDADNYCNADDDGHTDGATNGYDETHIYANADVCTLQRQGYDLPQARLEKP